MRELTFDLPMPVSLWSLYDGFGKARRKSEAYKGWQTEAGWMLITQRNRQGKHRRLTGAVEVSLRCYWHKGRRPDLDNLLKASLDLLTATQTIEDDSQVVAIDARWVPEGPPCQLIVRAA